MRRPRFEVVRVPWTPGTGLPSFHARIRASNGQIVWTTEAYRDKRDAVRAVEVLRCATGNEGLMTWETRHVEQDTPASATG